MFQAPYNTVTYSVIGDDDAPNYFQIDSATGQIRVRQSLLSDSASQYSLLKSRPPTCSKEGPMLPRRLRAVGTQI